MRRIPATGRRVENTKAYKEGYSTYPHPAPDKVCPYPKERGTAERTNWWKGYYSARSDDKLAHVIHKWGPLEDYSQCQN